MVEIYFPSWDEFENFLKTDRGSEILNMIPQIESSSNFRSWHLSDKPKELQNFTLCNDLTPGNLSQLGLNSYKSIADIEKCKSLQLIINDFHKTYKKAVECIYSYTKFLCFIEPEDHLTSVPISSTTFYHWPFCTFFTSAGFHFVQPDINFKNIKALAALDNIYHESLHQKLIVAIWMDKLFVNRRSISKDIQVYVPWRKSYWSLEHALQAAFVYVNLYELRKQFVNESVYEENRMIIDTSIRASYESAFILLKGLSEHMNLFNPNGINILAHMKDIISK